MRDELLPCDQFAGIGKEYFEDLERALLQAGVKVGRTMELGHTEAIKQAVMAGLGVAFVSIYAVCGELDTGRLQRARLRGPGIQRHFHVIHNEARTLTARVALANPDAQLVPGMFVTVQFANGGRRNVLLIPSEAVIETGTRRVVIMAQGEGRFRPVNVEVGSEGGGKTEIRSGLTAGQTVVVSGQFLLDSEASLKGTEERLQ